jgi:hypothetical protein
MQFNTSESTALWFSTVVMVILILAFGIPLILRLKNGVIPADPAQGIPKNIVRSISPRQFYFHIAILLLAVLFLIAMIILIWRAEPAGGGL